MSKEVLIRALWTLAEAAAGVGITYLASISAWWAAPIGGLLAAIKVHILDKEVKSDAGQVRAD